MKKNLTKYWPIILILAVSSLVVWPLFLPGYFSHHDDLQVMRIFEMRKCFSDFQIPCRWVPDMGYGNGFPLFNYYGVFPYYIGAIFSFITGYIWAAKILFFIPLVMGGVSMYLLGNKLWGKLPGIVVAVLFLFAPYRALDSFVRGAITESFAIAIVPLVFYFVVRLAEQRTLQNFLGVAITLGLFLLNHNIMTLFFLPILGAWVILQLALNKYRNILPLFLSIVLGFGMAAFFILPAYLEKSLIQSDSLTRLNFDFRAHFVTVGQLFWEIFWGYGSSSPGTDDTISFQIGWPHWWLAIIAVLFGIISYFTAQKKEASKLAVPIFLVIIFGLAIFMTHNKSAFVWEQIGILRFAQFPWRFLSVVIFSASLLGGFTVFILKWEKIKKYVAVAIILTTILLNWSFFRPERYDFSLTDNEKLSGVLWQIQQKAAAVDFLPITALEPRELAPNLPLVNSGQAQASNFINQSGNWSFDVLVKEQSTIEVPVFDFPNWQVRANKNLIPHTHQNMLGRIMFTLEPGEYSITGNLQNSPIRTIANIISLLSILVLAFIAFYGKHKKIFE